MGYLERNLLSTQDLSGITSGSLGITSGSRVPTILPTAIPDTTYLGSARSTTLLQPFALTIFGDGPSDAARAAASETSSTGTTFSATRIALGCGPCYLELLSLYSSSCALHCINQCDPLCASLHMRASAPLMSSLVLRSRPFASFGHLSPLLSPLGASMPSFSSAAIVTFFGNYSTSPAQP